MQQQAQAKSGVKKRVKLLFILYSNRFVSIFLPPEPELASCTTDSEIERSDADTDSFLRRLAIPAFKALPGSTTAPERLKENSKSVFMLRLRDNAVKMLLL